MFEIINGNIKILFRQISKDLESTFRDIVGFDLSFDEYKDFCREAWKDGGFNYLSFDRSKEKSDREKCFFTKLEKHIKNI